MGGACYKVRRYKRLMLQPKIKRTMTREASPSPGVFGLIFRRRSPPRIAIQGTGSRPGVWIYTPYRAKFEIAPYGRMIRPPQAPAFSAPGPEALPPAAGPGIFRQGGPADRPQGTDTAPGHQERRTVHRRKTPADRPRMTLHPGAEKPTPGPDKQPEQAPNTTTGPARSPAPAARHHHQEPPRSAPGAAQAPRTAPRRSGGPEDGPRPRRTPGRAQDARRPGPDPNRNPARDITPGGISFQFSVGSSPAPAPAGSSPGAPEASPRAARIAFFIQVLTGSPARSAADLITSYSARWTSRGIRFMCNLLYLYCA